LNKKEIKKLHNDHIEAMKAVGVSGPINPLGECFDSSFHCLVDDRTDKTAKLCHGIGIANAPGQEGMKMKHAWLENNGIAFDTTWGVKQKASVYRENLKLNYVVEYSKDEAFKLGLASDHTGPWDKKIKLIKGFRD